MCTAAAEVRTTAATSTASPAAVAAAAAFPRRSVSGTAKRSRKDHNGEAETEFRHSTKF
jgi:hypothetical protein